ncbi:hypothetical protein [Pontibacter oryzae]|uniref:Carboxypeptidase regulatory-like domain-containing protein n=1 Tax=Pontibacter oryzae TaxID=2304593 RepID=A0A399RXG5_9BACT|nr:hypothetical protein [Pontibacter oryzae]RIJ34075.1 hypothetical protein D1627_17075 [Pontibacter oryzae]
MKTLLRLQPSLWLLVLIPFLSGCNQEKDDYISKYCPGSCTIIKGRATINNGSTPLAGVTLLAQWHYSRYLSGSTIRKKAFATTDANGNYELRFLLRDDELQGGYIEVITNLDPEKYTYCQPGDFYYAGELERNTTLERNYALAAKATLELQLSNPDALGPNNSLVVTARYATAPTQGAECEQRIFWPQTTATQLLTVASGTPVTISIARTKNGQQTTENLTVQLQEGETLALPLTF